MIRLRKCCFHKIYENNIGNYLQLLVGYKLNVIGSTYESSVGSHSSNERLYEIYNLDIFLF